MILEIIAIILIILAFIFLYLKTVSEKIGGNCLWFKRIKN